MDITRNKEEFSRILLSTNRKGAENVLESLTTLGFFTAPASSFNHLAEEGGLCRHSLNVYLQADAIRSAQIRLNPMIEDKVPMDSIILTSLLHDCCKADIYKKVEKFRKDKDGKWEKYFGWDRDYTSCPLGHGEKSVIRLLKWGLDMDLPEIAAIRWHMAGWDMSDTKEAKDSFHEACKRFPLLSILIAADELATRITEVD